MNPYDGCCQFFRRRTVRHPIHSFIHSIDQRRRRRRRRQRLPVPLLLFIMIPRISRSIFSSRRSLSSSSFSTIHVRGVSRGVTIANTIHTHRLDHHQSRVSATTTTTPLSSASHSSTIRSSTPARVHSQQRSSYTNGTHASASSTSSSTSSPSSLRVWLALAAALGVSTLTLAQLEACGIVAFVGDEPALPYLLEGITILQNRGYDSAGVATINTKGELIVTKFASKGTSSDSIQTLQNEAPAHHNGDSIGIAHTRWATHGGKTDENAHPHVDYKGRVALVHNGTIENSAELKSELEALGIPFKSQTDTEVIVQLIGHYLDGGATLNDAVKKTLARLEGTWGLVIMHKDFPHQVIAARNGSPLVIGLGAKRMFVASEVCAFSRHTSQYIALNDGELATIRTDGSSLDLSRVERAPEEHIELSPAPYAHWTLKEIMEQPEAISRTLNYGARFDNEGLVKLGGMQANAQWLLNIRHLVLSACGTSLYASMYGAALLRSLKCFDTVQTVDAAEISNDMFAPTHSGLLVLSQSGETKDTHRAVQLAENQLVPCFSIVNQVGSLIARSTGCGLYLNAGREHAVASTKAFTTQVTALALVAGWFAQMRDKNVTDTQRRHELIQSIHRLPIYAGITLRTHDQCKRIAERLAKKDHVFILGKGFAEPIAREGALKIKEITYAHAEAYSGGALKHGPFALLDDGIPVVMLIMDDQHAELMRIAAAEVKARGADVFVITDKRSLARGICDEESTIVVPNNGPLSALLATIPLQLIAYEMALRKGINPDRPRHLAKAVTVD